MPTIERPHLAALIILLGCSGLPLAAAADSAPASPVATAPLSRLTATSETGLTTSHGDVYHFDFGAVSKLETGKLEHVFTLVNSGAAPLLIDQARASCGCTSAVLGSAGNPVTLKVGDTVQVNVAIDLAQLEGPIRKSVTLYSGSAPLLTLELTAQIQGAVSFSPEVIDFGEVRAGSSPARRLSLTIDARALTAGSTPDPNWPILLCSNPDIAFVAETNAQTGNQWQVNYAVTLSPQASLGAIGGSIRISPMHFAVGVGKDLQARTVSLGGEVKGRIDARPSAVVMGTVTVGHRAASTVTIYGDSGMRAAAFKIATTSKWIEASLKPILTGDTVAANLPGQPAFALLEIAIKAGAPLGLLREQVSVTCSDGERLKIPVLCYVVTP